MKKLLAFFFLTLTAALTFAQTVPASREPNDATKVAIAETYSASVNGGVGSATVTSIVVPFHPRWAVEANAFLLPGADSKIITLGPRYARNLGNFVKRGKLFFDPNNLDIFFHIGLGGKQQQLPAGFNASAFSAYGEAGVVYHKGPIDIVPLKVGFLRTSFGHNGTNAFLSPNVSEIGAAVGFHF